MKLIIHKWPIGKDENGIQLFRYHTDDRSILSCLLSITGARIVAWYTTKKGKKEWDVIEPESRVTFLDKELRKRDLIPTLL
jgi:hypothetical protein